MKEKQRIRISGTNWNDIIKLPCFRELWHYGSKWTVLLLVSYVDGGRIPFSGTEGHIGDNIVEYTNGDWELLTKEVNG